MTESALPVPDTFVIDLYEAVLDGRGLAGVVRPLAEMIGCSTHAVHLIRCEGGTIRPGRSDPGSGGGAGLLDEYAQHWMHQDPWAHAAARAGDGLMNMSRVVPPWQYRQTPIWNEWGRPRDAAFHCISVQVRSPGETMGVLAFHRSVRAEPFGPQEEAVVQAVYPYLRRALLAEARLAAAGWDATRALRAGFAALRQGVVLLDRQRRLVLTNLALDAMAAEEDGLTVVPDGGLSSHDPAARQALARGIGTALLSLTGKVRLLPEAASLTLPRRSGGAPWLVQVLPLRGLEAPSGQDAFTGVMLLVTDDQHRPRPKAPLLRQAFGLTAAEGSLAAALAAGRSLAQHAEARKISVETARTQLAAIRKKTGCRRQPELAALLARLTG